MKFSIALFSIALTSAHAKTSWNVLTDAQLPKPVSDHSSTFVPAQEGTTDGIYIAGGCDSPEGNTYRDAFGLELDFFLCESISDELHVFNADTMTFETKAKLPRPRYRHAAVHAQGKLWLVGGRTIPEDLIIPEVDVYDPVTDTWSTVGKIPTEFGTSDNGAFASPDGSSVFVVGGYNQNYFAPDALATTISFDTQTALNQLTDTGVIGDLSVREEASLLQGRGDIHAVTTKDGSKAIVAGGTAGICQPLTSAEVYDFETKTWSSAGDLLKARSDGALVEAGGSIFSIGGEVNHPDQCAAPELVPPLSHQSLAVDDVEALDYADGNVVWKEVGYIPEFRFRFSAASWPSTGTAYAFGGQTTFDEECLCFPTTTEITSIDSDVLLSGKPTELGDSGANGMVGGAMVALSAVVGTFMVMTVW